MTDSNEIVPAANLPAKITDKQADQMAWVFGRIAEGHYSPGPPGSSWGGREEVVISAMGVLEIDRAEAEKVVDQSVASLWAGTVEDNKHVLRATMIFRLVKMSELLTSMIGGSRSEMTWVFKRIKGKGIQKLPMKEKIVPNDNNAIIGRLLEVNRDLAVLQGIDGGQHGTSASIPEILEQLKQFADGAAAKKKKGIPGIKAGGAGAQLIIDAAGGITKRKQVKSDIIDQKKE